MKKTFYDDLGANSLLPITASEVSPSDNASGMATDDVSSIPSGNASSMPSDNASGMATDNASSMPSDNASGMASDNASGMATDDASSIPSDDASPTATGNVSDKPKRSHHKKKDVATVAPSCTVTPQRHGAISIQPMSGVPYRPLQTKVPVPLIEAFNKKCKMCNVTQKEGLIVLLAWFVSENVNSYVSINPENKEFIWK